MQDPGEDKPTYSKEYWKLEGVGNEGEGLFMTCSFPTLTLTKADVKHVGTSALPKSTSVKVNHAWSDVTLTRGLDSKGDLYKWIAQGLPDEGGGGGKIEKKEVTLAICGGEDHETEVVKYILTGCWPTSHGGLTSDTKSGDIQIESITLTFDTCRAEYAEGG